MKKIFKKFLTTSLSCLLLMSLSATAFAQEPTTTSIDGRAVLLNSGWTEDEINKLLSPEEIAKYTNAEEVNQTVHYVKQTIKVKVNKGLNALKSEDTALTLTPIEGSAKMVPMNEDQLYSELSKINATNDNPQTLLELGQKESSGRITPQNQTVEYTIPDGYMKYTMQAFYLGSGNFQLNLRSEWLKTPLNRGIDVLALGHGSGLVQTGTQSNITFSSNYDVVSSGSTFTLPINSESTIVDSGGTAITFELPPSSENFNVYSIRTYMSYHATKSNSGELATSINGYYKHKVTNLKIEPSISFPLAGGLAISTEDTYVTESPTPYFSIQF